MSTIVVVKKENIATIGADSLTKLGYTNETAEYIKNYTKIIQFKDNYIAYVGHASFGLILNDYFAKQKRKIDLNNPQNIFKEACYLHVALKEDYFLNPHEDEDDEFESLQTDLLIMNKYGIFGLYSLRSVQEYNKFYAFGDGFKYSLGAMFATYESDKSATEIAEIGLQASIAFDDSTAAPFDTISIKLPK